MNEICKALEQGGEVTLSKSESEKLREYIGGLEQEHSYAEAYREELCDRLRAALREKGVALDYAVEHCIIKKLSIAETQAIIKALSAKERRAVPQLCSANAGDTVGNTEFKI